MLHMPWQFLAWDTFARRRIDLVGRKDDGDKVIAHEFDFSKVRQVRLSALQPWWCSFSRLDHSTRAPCIKQHSRDCAR